MFLNKILDKFSIKKMVFLNGLLIFSIACGATVFNLISTTTIQKKLSHLTSQSTPFQVKTIQAQALLQEATTVMTKMSASPSVKDLDEKMTSMKKTLSQLKTVSSELTALSLGDSKVERVVNDFKQTSEHVYSVTKEKIEAEGTAKEASKKMSAKLAEIAKRLQEIDIKIKNIQKGASTKLNTASGTVVKAFNVVRDLYDISKIMRSVEVAYDEVKRSDNKRVLDIAKGKFFLASNKALATDFLRGRDKDKEIKKLYDGIKDVQTKITAKDGFADLLDAYLAKQDPESRKKVDALDKQISSKLYNISSQITSYMDTQLEDISFSSRDLTDSVNVSGLSNAVLLLSSELVSLGYSIEGDASKLLLVDNTQALAAQISTINTKFTHVDEVIKKLSEIFKSLGRKDDIAFMQKVTLFFKDVRETLIGGAGLSKKIDKVIQAQQNAVTISQQIEKMVAEQQQKSKAGLTLATGEQEKATLEVNKIVKWSLTASIFIGCIAILIGLVAGSLGGKTIGSSISQVTKVANAIAEGDLSQDIKVQGPPEIRSMGESFSKMKTDLKEMIEKIITSANTVSSHAAEIMKAADTLSNGVHNQAFQTEQAAASVQEMSQTIADVAKNASNAALESKHASERADKGHSSVEMTVQEMHQIVETFKKISDTIGKLGQRSAEIGNIISVINDIAEQTNLLALNAAIEAARAGEQGRGFAVVADEVRKLAERTADATGQIGGMIKGIQDEINTSISAMMSGKGMVEKSVDTARESQTLLGNIVDSSNKSTEMIHLIATAAEELSQVSDNISENMDHVTNNARDSKESADLMKDTSHELAKLADELNNLVKWFKLEEEAKG